ncbi:hypothetical protein ACEPAI_3707 [Sanghuangporus weigelae]
MECLSSFVLCTSFPELISYSCALNRIYEGLLIAELTSGMLRSMRAANPMYMAGEACTFATLGFLLATFQNFVSKLLTLRWILWVLYQWTCQVGFNMDPYEVLHVTIPPFGVIGISAPFRINFLPATEYNSRERLDKV